MAVTEPLAMEMKRPVSFGRRLSNLFDRHIGRVLLAPAMVVLFSLTTYPILFLLYYSVQDLDIYNFKSGSYSFVGLENFAYILGKPEFWQALKVTLSFVAGAVFLTFVVSFSLALLLDKEVRLRKILSPLLLLPLMATPVVVGLMWNLLLAADTGVVNYLLALVGIQGPNWMSNVDMSLLTVILVDVWQHVPFMFFSILAGLAMLPEEPYEAATLDGASSIQIFRDLTLPFLKSILLVVVLFRLIGAFTTFDMIYILTGGGPGIATQTLSIYLYKTAFTSNQISVASSLGVLILMVVGAISVGLIRMLYQTEK